MAWTTTATTEHAVGAPAVRWPNNAKLALWVNVGFLQFFPEPARQTFGVPGGMTMPYPTCAISLRDYGNRVGIYRFLRAFDEHGITPTFAVNTRLAERALPAAQKFSARRRNHLPRLEYGQPALRRHGTGAGEEAA